MAVDSLGLNAGLGALAVLVLDVDADGLCVGTIALAACGGFKNRANLSASRIKGDLLRRSRALSWDFARVCQSVQALGAKSRISTSGSSPKPKLALSVISAKANPVNRIVGKRAPALWPTGRHCLAGKESGDLRTQSIVRLAGTKNMNSPQLHNKLNINSQRTVLQGETEKERPTC